MASRTAYSTWTPQKPTLFDGHYLRNRSTVDIGVLGYIGIPKFCPFLLGHPVYIHTKNTYVCVCVCVQGCANPWRRFAVATKCWSVTPNVYGFSVPNWFDVTLLPSWTMRWALDFSRKMCPLFLQLSNPHNEWSYPPATPPIHTGSRTQVKLPELVVLSQRLFASRSHCWILSLQ